MASSYDIQIDQGSDVIIPFLLEDTSGNKQDLATYTVRMQIRVSSYSKDILDELSTENGRIVLKEDPSSDQVTSDGSKPKCIIECTWSNKLTSQFPTGNHVYDIELISADDHVSRLLNGRFIVSREVTR